MSKMSSFLKSISHSFLQFRFIRFPSQVLVTGVKDLRVVGFLLFLRVRNTGIAQSIGKPV